LFPLHLFLHFSHLSWDITLLSSCRCLIPLVVSHLVRKFNGSDLLVNGRGPWCPQYELYNDSDFLVLRVSEYENYEITRSRFNEIFIVLALIFIAIDVTWMLMVWGATTVGTPTQPMGRNEYLR